MTDAIIEKPKKLCFVVGPIGEVGSETRRHSDWLLKGIFKPALEQLGYNVKRADEDAKPGMISNSIIHDILNAELVVADLTELNPNAFYELGNRHSRERPTIHVARTGTKLPFDNIGYACIFIDIGNFDDVTAKIDAVHNSAKETEKDDFQVSNPITQANAGFRMKESADPKDQLIEQLMERVSRLEERDRSLVVDNGDSAVIREITALAKSIELDEIRRSALTDHAFIHWVRSGKALNPALAVRTAQRELDAGQYKSNALVSGYVTERRNALIDLASASSES